VTSGHDRQITTSLGTQYGAGGGNGGNIWNMWRRAFLTAITADCV
jgi:hypothetical protein